MASRVTMSANWSSDQPSVPAGRSGITKYRISAVLSQTRIFVSGARVVPNSDKTAGVHAPHGRDRHQICTNLAECPAMAMDNNCIMCRRPSCAWLRNFPPRPYVRLGVHNTQDRARRCRIGAQGCAKIWVHPCFCNHFGPVLWADFVRIGIYDFIQGRRINQTLFNKKGFQCLDPQRRIRGRSEWL